MFRLQQCLVRGSICALGDTLVQKIEQRNEPINMKRSIGWFSFGVLTAPIIYTSFLKIPTYFANDCMRPLKTSALFELIVWPTTCLPIMMYSTELWKGKTIRQTTNKLYDEGIGIATASAGIWVPLSYLQVRYVPLRHVVYVRSTFCASSAVALSYYTNRHEQKQMKMNENERNEPKKLNDERKRTKKVKR